MTEYPEIIAAFMVAAVVFLGALLADARRYRGLQEEQHLEGAIAALRVHYESMRKLDDADMPSQLLDLVLQLTKIVNDKRSVEVVTNAFRSLAVGKQEPPSEEEEALSRLFRDLAKRRPDLAQAFTTAVMTAVIAVIARWPYSASAFNPVLVEVVAEPVEETMRVVRYARNDRGVAIGGFAHAA
jgi:hypothetical protein